MKTNTLATILDRAMPVLAAAGYNEDRLSVSMDLHFSGCDLGRLAGFPEFDFAHDILGIARHFDRRTKTMRDCFVPRCGVVSPRGWESV